MKSCRLDAYVIETLMADLVLHERSPSAFFVYLYLWHGASARRRTVRASHQEMALATGLSKSAVQGAIRTLARRRLIRAERDSITAVPVYSVLKPWRARRGLTG
jgi:DNA-binding transcriptional ArsR family regulator